MLWLAARATMGTPSLGTSICCQYGPKMQKKKKKKKKERKKYYSVCVCLILILRLRYLLFCLYWADFSIGTGPQGKEVFSIVLCMREGWVGDVGSEGFF